MKRSISIVLALFAIFFITAAFFKLKQDNEEGLTVEQFLKKVNKKDTVVLVYFNADWCVPCIKLKPVIADLDKEVSSYAKVMPVDVDDNPLVATHFEINTLPMFMIYKNGKNVWKHTGYLVKADLNAKINLYK